MTKSRLFTCVARFAGTLVPVDLVNAGSIVAGIALAVINVDFTVDSWEKENISLSEMSTNKILCCHI